jgi:uncharacterized protein (DUF2147 family)
MRHQCAAAIGLLTAALLAPVSPSHAASADPTGYWKKPDAERESKIEVFKCGKKKTNLCAKIAWLKEPNDSKGQPLHDVRNENPALRGRQILGLPIFTDLVPSAPSTWNGKIYNPEDGRTYTATLTVVSRKQILLKGCKAWLLCGERNWFRTAPPEAIAPAVPPAEGEQQIEASVTPDAPASAAAVAAVEPVAVPSADEAVVNASTAPTAPKEMQATVAPQLPAAPAQAEAAEVVPVAAPAPAAPSMQTTALPVEPPADVATGGGYGFLAVSTDPGAKAPQSGEDVSSMMLMAKPIAAETAATPAAKPVAATPLPEPKAQAKPPVATAAPKPAAPKPAAKPVTTAAAKPAATAAKPTATATATAKPAAAPAAKPVTAAAAKPAAKPETQGEAAEQDAATPPDGEAAAIDGIDPNAAETADASALEPIPLTRRERRLLRKQQRDYERAQQDPLLPWLQ